MHLIFQCGSLIRFLSHYIRSKVKLFILQTSLFMTMIMNSNNIVNPTYIIMAKLSSTSHFFSNISNITCLWMLLNIKGHDNTLIAGPANNNNCSTVISRDCQRDLPRWSFSLGKLARGETVTILKPAASSASHIKSLALLNSEARQKSDREMMHVLYILYHKHATLSWTVQENMRL